MTRGKKLKSVILTVLMVLSVVAIGSAGFAGTVAADDDESIEPYDLELDADGDLYTVGFPGPVDGTYNDVFASGTDGIAVVYAFEDGDWEQVTDFNESIDTLDAIVIATDDDAEVDTVDLEVGFERQSSPGAPTQQSLDEGWNFLSASAYEDADSVFGVNDVRLVLDRFDGGTSPDLQQVDSFNNYFAGADNAPAVDPFKGYFVYAEDDTAIPSVLSGAQDRADADEQLGVDLPDADAGSLTFSDQALGDDGQVTVEDVESNGAATIAVTYTDGDDETIAGLETANNRNGQDVSVTIADDGGFPGEHTAWLFADGDLPAEADVGDGIDATPLAELALDSDSATVTAPAEGELTFNDQVLTDGEVTVSNATTAQESTIAVTYSDGDNETIAGLAAADELDDEDVNVEIEDDGGFPGEHTAWVFDDGDVPDEAGIGADATPIAGDALDSDRADVSAPAEGELTFNDQELDDGNVTVSDVTTAQESTIAVTYTDGDEETIAGLAAADELENEDVRVAIEDDGGFPGEHTAWVFDNDDVSDGVDIGDDATPIAELALDSDSANVTAPAEGKLTFDDQVLADGDVTVSDVTSAQESTIAVTYTDGEEEVIAGLAAADELENEDVSVEIEDDGGFPGEHTAWVFDDDDVPEDVGIGDDATPIAGDALDSDTANVTAPAEGELTFNDQEVVFAEPLDEQVVDAGQVTVSNVSTAQESTIAVTYTDGKNETIAGLEAADNLDGEDVSVTIADDGGFPGEHTAWVFDDDDVPEGVGIGDDATPIAGDALDFDSANVTAPAEGELTFDDQELADGDVTVSDVTSAQESTIAVTYTDGDNETIAGLAAADELDDEDVGVEIEDAGGFPGEHTAWVFDNDDVPEGVGIGADATPIAGDALDSDSANVTAPAEGELTFDDQQLANDDKVTVSNVTTAQESTIAVTYTDGDEEIIAGFSPANELDDEDVTVAIADEGGFPGEHTAWVFDNADVPDDVGIGDDATPIAGDALDSDSAEVRGDDATQGSLTFDNQSAAVTLDIVVTDVETNGDATLVVTYTDGDEEILAGVESADDLGGDDVTVTLDYTHGIEGEHTAWLFADSDVPDDVEGGDDVSELAGSELATDSAFLGTF